MGTTSDRLLCPRDLALASTFQPATGSHDPAPPGSLLSAFAPATITFPGPRSQHRGHRLSHTSGGEPPTRRVPRATPSPRHAPFPFSGSARVGAEAHAR